MPNDFLYFGRFRLQPTARTVWLDGVLVELTEKEFDLLLLLVRNSGQILSKGFLIESLWPGRFVEDSNLGHHIKALRKKLGDEGDPIRTAHRRGYYFAATVSDTPPAKEVSGPQAAQHDVGRSQDVIPESSTNESTTQRRHRFLRPTLRFGLPATVLILLATIGQHWVSRTHKLYPRPSVAVFGFVNSTAQPDAAWLSAALSEMFRTELIAGGGARVLPGEDVDRAKAELTLPSIDSLGKDSLARIRHNLNADYALLGSYIRIGQDVSSQLRLDLKLQDTTTGEVVVSVSKSGATTRLFELVSQSAEALSVKLRRGSVSSDVVHGPFSRNPEATRLYAEGLTRLRLYDAIAAARLLEEATKVDPKSALIHSALGEAWSTLGYRDKAQREAKEASDLGSNLPRETLLSIQARYHEILRDWDRAIGIYQSLWTVFADNPEHGLHLASAQTSAHKGSAALATLAELRHNAPQLAGDARVELAEAVASESLGDSKGELAAARRAIAKADRVGARLLVAQAQLRACWALDNLSQWDEALALAQTARRTFSEFGDRASEAHAVKNIADVQDDRGDHTAAVHVYQEAIALYRAIGHQDGLAATLNNLGEAFRSLGDLDNAKQSYEESANISAVTGDWKLQAIVLNGVGSILWRRADIAGAQAAYEKAVAGLRRAGDRDLLANSLLNLAEVLQDEGYLDDGLKLFEESLALAEEVDDKSSAARIHGDMGELLLRKGDLLGAKKRFNDQLALGTKIPDDRQRAYALHGLGQVHLAQGEIADARSSLSDALNLRAKLNEKGLVAETRLALAQLEVEDNRSSVAALNAREAADEFRAEKEVDQESLAYALLARSLVAEGDIAEAANAAHRSAELVPKVQSVARRLSIAVALARVQATQGDLARARSGLQSALDEAVKLRSLPQELEIRSVLCELDSQSCTPELEKEARDKGFLLIAKKAAITRAGATRSVAPRKP
jgi:DNA-binding winged helix-turn-helix (wHTH) protein/tetratricopeptide (TPR) repeat protein